MRDPDCKPYPRCTLCNGPLPYHQGWCTPRRRRLAGSNGSLKTDDQATSSAASADGSGAEGMNLGDAISLAQKQGLKPNEYLRWEEQAHAGQRLPRSRQYNRANEPTGRVLIGTSVLTPRGWAGPESRRLRRRLSAVDSGAIYAGTPYVVRGTRIRSGQDAAEVIIADAVVVRPLVEQP